MQFDLEIQAAAEDVFAKETILLCLGQCLANILAVVEAAGGRPTDIVRMTAYVTDLDAYRSSLRAIGGVDEGLRGGLQ